MSFSEWINKKKATQEAQEEKRKSNTLSATGNTITFSEWIDNKVASRVDESYINNFISDASNFLKSAEKDYSSIKWDNASSVYNSKYTEWDNLNRRKKIINIWLNNNKDRLDKKFYNSLSDSLSNYDKGSISVINTFESANEYYSQWETEDAYKDAVKAQEDYEAMVNFDLVAGQKEIEGLLNGDEITALKKNRDTLRNDIRLYNRGVRTTYKTSNDVKKAKGRLSQIEKKIEEIEKQADQKQVYWNNANRVQTGIKLHNDALNAKDFKEKSQYVSTATGSWFTTYGMGYDDLTYEYINNQNNIRGEIKQKYSAYSSDNPFDDGESEYEENSYDHMTDEEIAIYNYYYSTEGKNKAEEYLKTIQEGLNLRRGNAEFEKYKGNIALEYLYGVVAGLDQFESGIKNLSNFDDDYIPASATQVTSGLIREDLADSSLPIWYNFKEGKWEDEIMGNSLGQVGYDLTTTTANMLPSIITSTAIGVINPVAGQVVGAGLMGASASGNAYAEMLNLGYDKGQARLYSALVGASEATLQYLIGGIGKLGGGKLTTEALVKIANNMDNAFARVAIKLGAEAIGEFTEEYLQEVLNPFFKNLTLGTNEDVKLFSTEALYSGILGALSAGILEGGSTIASDVRTTNLGKSVQKIDGGVARLKKLGATFSADAVAHQIADEITEETGAYKIGLLLQEAGATLSEQNVSDIVIELTKKGMDESSAKKIAKLYQEFLNGEMSLTDEQVETLENLEPLANVLRKSIIGRNSAVYQRTREYNDLVQLATEMESKSKESSAPQTDTEVTRPTNVPYSTEYIESVAKEYEAAGMSPEQAKIMAMAQLSESDEGKSLPAEENLVESKYEVSADGKTINTKNDEIVTIKKIESVSDDGEANLTLNDGMVVKASDLSFGSDAEAIFIENIGNIKVGKNPIGTNSANALYHTAMNALKDKPNMTASEADSLIRGLIESYVYGTYNLGRSKLTTRDANGKAVLFAGELSQEQRQFAYELGTKDAMSKTEADQKVIDDLKAKADPNSKKKHLGKIIFEKGAEVDESTLTATQKANLDGIKLLAQISSVEFHVFRSDKEIGFKYTMADGTVVSANGWFVGGTNQIWVDLNAGNFGEGTMIRTAAHEISHYIKQWSPQKWTAMADLLMEEFAKNGVNTESMLNKQIAKIKRRYKANKKTMPSESVILDMAYEELVCDALADMLTDGSIVNFIAEVKAKDANLAKRILNAIKSLLKKWGLIIDDYKDRDLDTPEAQALSQLEDTFKKLQAMFQEAFMDANEAVSTIGIRNLADFAEAKNTEGESLFQYRAMEADEAIYRDMLRKWGKMTDTQINNLFTTIDKAMDIIKDNLEMLDYAWEADINDRAFSPVKPNSDSLYQVSLDFSTLCRKRILQQTIQAQLQEALNRPLTREEGIAIRDALMALQEEGRQIEVACALCYVESARMKSPAQIKKFLNNREAVIKDFFAGKADGSMKGKIKQAEVDARARLHKENPNGIKGKDGSMLDPRDASLKAMPKKYADEIRSAKKEAKQSYNPTAEEQRLINVAKGMTVSDFTSPEGLENLAKQYPALFDAYTSYIRNATKSKGIEGDTWWRAGDSSKIGDVLIANMNRENGLRSQSWSDFQVIHILDYIAATIELSTRNAKEQAYSKVPDYVELMGQTGVMINMSLIPTRDFNGSLEYDSIEGMDYKRALELREKYPATAGTICIGIDNKQIQMLLADITIDYVIPYHKSGMAASIRKLMHIPTWSQYEEYQSESNLSDTEAKKNAEKYGVKLLDKSDPNYHKHTAFSEWFDPEVAKQIAKKENANPSNKAMQKKYGVMYGGYMAMQNAANNYLKLCAERGLAPKFSNEKADFTAEENYWKLLIDRKMVNNATGEIIKQQTIKPAFNETEVLRILNDELERYPSVKADQDYATRRVTEKFLSGEIKSGMSAEAIAKVMQKPVDNIAKTNIIASAKEIKAFDSSEKLFSERDLVPTFYSQMGKVVEGVKQEKLAANSVVNMLRGKGVKAEEIRWSGIVPFLEGKKSVTKHELLDFINGSMLQIGEQMSSNNIDLRYDGSTHTYSLYDNNGNVVNTFKYNEFMGGYVSENDDEIYANAVELEDALREEYGSMSSPRWSQYKLDGGTNYRELVFTMPNSSYSNNMMRTHWGEDAEGVLVHARIQDFDVNGKKMLFIEEIQSDWHNEGHKHGYEGDFKNSELGLARKRYVELGKELEKMHEDLKNAKSLPIEERHSLMDSYFDKSRTLENERDSLYKKFGLDVVADTETIPDAPFKDTYHEFVLKRLLRMAAEQGYDSIGWTPSEIQSQRWSDEYAEGYRIEYDQDIPKFLKKYGRQWGAKVDKTFLGDVTQEKASYVISSDVGNDGQYYSTIEEAVEVLVEETNENFGTEFSTESIDIDEWDDTVRVFDEETGDEIGTLHIEYGTPDSQGIKEIWSMDITDSMRDSVLYEGQVMYSERDSEGNTLTKEQIDFFKDSKVRNEDGNLLVMYHGTDNGGFTIFDPSKSDDKTSLFLTASKEMAQTYAISSKEISLDGTNNQSGIYSVYANIANPYVVDAKGSNWNKIRTGLNPFSQSTRDIAQKAKRKGYDGVIIKNLVDAGFYSFMSGEKVAPDTVVIAFDSNQIKSVDNANPTTDPDIRYSDRDIKPITEAEYKELESHFGTTGNFRVAGYLLTDGKLLDFSGKHWGDTESRMRQVDHRDVQEVLDDRDNGFGAMVDMIGNGNIRLMPETGGICLAVYPNEKQRRVLSQYINYMLNTEGQIIIDYDAVGGDTVYSKEYGRTATSKQILNDIRNYFNGGRQSELMQFHTMYQERDPSTSNRSILAKALLSAAQNDIERNKLAQYKEKISLIEAEEQRLSEIQKQLFTKDAVEPAKRKELQFEAKQISNRINTYDRQLLNLEATTALKNVLNREKALAMKKQKQIDAEYLKQYKEKVQNDKKALVSKYQESRKKAVESRTKTAMRHKIKNVVNDLNNLLLKPSKERHVPEEMRIAVAEALALVNMDTVDADTRVAHYNGLIAKATDPDVIASLTETRDRILNQGNKLADKLTKLKDAYGMVRDSADDSLRSMYDDVIYNKIESVQKAVGKTPLRNMTLGQLESVYELYKMVLTTIRDSNKAFAENLTLTRQALGSNTFAEIKENNKVRDRIKHQFLEKSLWQNLKPMQAMKTIGSNTLQTLWNNILYGQEVFAQDYYEAVEFAKEMKDKHGYKKWNKDKLYSFESKSGKIMKLNLEQMMSIYAYSKRQQADEHIEYGGILLNESIIKEKNKLGKTVEIKVNDSTAYRLDRMQVGKIIETLEKEAPGAKNFVDEMQKYLSETMGNKGNEVSMKMYGVKLFKEEHYFPLKSSKDFMEAANAKLKGDVKIKNKGMTKSTVEHARTPIVLENFLDVWGNHINEMSMYHGLVLPLEDFSRTLNYSFKADDTLNTDAESVRTALHDAFGENADNYLNELLKAINGGVLHDSSAQFADKMISKFKKAKVMASLSVIVQQPTAIIRAMGIIEPKYFVAQNFNHKATWEELKTYCPTAIIKETGSFDTNMGRTIVDMIKDERGFTDKVGDFLGKAPAYMDEVGWNMIWRALKKKVATEQKLSGEELLKECGKQMTLIINETQVYDSVMSRNELMRSKNALTKMATAFMAEPSTVANMIYGATLDIKRGKKGIASKTIAATIGSVAINGLVSAMVYALRDDDEDETFLEKYLSSATTEVLDGLNPLTYIPFVKDAYSLFQGYKVERTDMALIKDVVEAIDDFYNVLDPEAYEGMSRKEIAQHIYDNSVPLLTSICDMFGLPVGNVLRDAEAIIINDNVPMSQTSSKAIGYAFEEGVLNTLPKIAQKVIGTDSKQDKLYDAIVDGDTAYVDRMKSGYKDEKAYEAAVRKALRDNDSRIREAAEARISGDIAEYARIVKEIKAEGFFSQDTIVASVNAEIGAINKGESSASKNSATENKESSIHTMDDYFASIVGGDQATAYVVKEDIIKTDVANGKDRDEAEDNFNSKFASHVREQYEDGYISDYDAEKMLVNYGGKSEQDAASKVQYWSFKQEYPDYDDLSEEAVDKYYNDVEPHGISIHVYYDYSKQRSKCKGTDKNGDGKTDSGSVKKEVLQVINSLPITKAQKDALYYINGWSSRTIYEAPWR